VFSPQEIVLVLAVIIQLAAVRQHYKLSRWSQYITSFHLYGACFILMIVPRAYAQFAMWGYLPVDTPKIVSTLSFLIESILLFLAGRLFRKTLWREVKYAVKYDQENGSS
jgi:hypothetical protein